MKPTLVEIHENLVNGNRRDCVKQINKYGQYDFWSNYREYLESTYQSVNAQYSYFSDMTTSYFRINGR